MRLTIKNFGPIKEFDFEIKPMTVLIGEQATGKSMVAKWLYFWQTLNLELPALMGSEKTPRTNERIKILIDNFVLRKFMMYWGAPANWEGASINYTSGHILSLAIRNGMVSYEINNNKSLDVDYVTYNKIKFWNDRADAFDSLALLAYSGMSYASKHLDSGSLYFPASRASIDINGTSALADVEIEKIKVSLFDVHELKEPKVEDHLFFLNRINLLIKHSYIRSVKEFIRVFQSISPELPEKFKEILKGSLEYQNSGEFIKTKDGRVVQFAFAATGQQEVVRILQDLYFLGLKNDPIFRIYEEPEAHLWPSSIIALIDLIYDTTHERGYSIITTHSPIVCNTLNIRLAAGAKDIEVILLADGVGKSIIDPETKIIDLSSSFEHAEDEIINRFNEALPDVHSNHNN